MRFLFTTSSLIGAKAIRSLLQEPCSHFCVTFDERPNGFGIVFHSSFHGVRIEWANDFLKRNRVVYGLTPREEKGLEFEERIYQSLVSSFYGADYDWGLFAEFGFYAARRRLLGTPIPPRSRIGKSHAYLCTEIAPKIKDVAPEYFGEPLPEMISPYRLYLSMKRSAELVDAGHI